VNAAGVVPVTARKATLKAAVLANPTSADTRPIGSPRDSRSMALTIRARWRHDLNVIPVSAGNTRLIVRTDVPARDASSAVVNRCRTSAEAR
jgi:hypothetical protein